MLTSFEVGAVFRIVNDASPQLRALIEQVTKLDGLIVKANDNLKKFAETFKLLTNASNTTSSTLSVDFGEINKVIDRSIDRVAVLKGEFMSLRAPTSSAATLLRPPAGGGR